MSAEPTTSSADDYVIEVKGVSKAYRIWRDPAARLKFPLLQALGGILPKALQPAALRRRIGESHNTPYYKDFFALQDINFSVRRGEAVGIIGRNGSGKSTLLQIIAGTLTPTSGTVRVKGRVAALLELGSGFNPDFTGRENVYLNASILGLSREETQARFSEIAAFADIGDFIDQPVKTYSSGMTMRLAFAVQIAIAPDILIVDEALSVGDEAFQRKCFAHLHKLRESGTTLLFVSHDAGTVTSICDHAILLEKGRLITSGAPKPVLTEYHRRVFSALAQPSSDRAPDQAQPHSFEIAPASTPDEDPESYFDENLRAAASTRYVSVGAAIEQIDIYTLGGRRVNNLKHGGTYRISLRARYEEDCFGVFYGSTITTLNGINISGFNHPPRTSPIAHVPKGTIHTWNYTFRCLLLPGSYSIEAGIGGIRGEESGAFLHRIVDACLFRVLPSIGLSSSSYLVSLEQSAISID